LAKSPARAVHIWISGGDAVRGVVESPLANGLAGLGLSWKVQFWNLDKDPLSPQGEQADRVVIIAPQEVESAWKDSIAPLGSKAEVWPIHLAAPDLNLLRAEVNGWIARLLTGETRKGPPDLTPKPTPVSAKTNEKEGKASAPKPKKISVGRETKGRAGKGVTTLFDIPLSAEEIKDLAQTIKQKCGTGGTVKDGRIEIQGDQRERIVAELEKLGYQVKKVGG